MGIALTSMFTKPHVPVPQQPLFYGDNTHGVQVWYAVRDGHITAHLQDGVHTYTGVGTTCKRALKMLENTAPERYHHTINYMRVLAWVS